MKTVMVEQDVPACLRDGTVLRAAIYRTAGGSAGRPLARRAR